MKTLVLIDPRGPTFDFAIGAQKLGYTVVSIESGTVESNTVPSEYSQGLKYIQERIFISSTFPADTPECNEVLAKLLEKYKVSAVIWSVDASFQLALRIQEKIGIKNISPSAALNLLDKYNFRKKLVKAGLSRLKAYTEEEFNNLKLWPFNGKAFIKPRMGMGSLLVQSATSMEDARKKLSVLKETHLNLHPRFKSYLKESPGFFIEEAANGELLSAEGLSSNGHYQSLGLLSRILYSENDTIEMGSVFPYPRDNSNKIVDLAKRVLDVSGYAQGPSHLEFIVNPNGSMELIDFNPRLAGADVYQSIKNSIKESLAETIVKNAAAESPEPLTPTRIYSCLQYFFGPVDTPIENITFPKNPSIKFDSVLVPKGYINKSTTNQLECVGCYIVTNNTFQGALDESRKIRNQILINGVNSARF